jgi:thiamine biosynthesis lipoprotein
VSITMAPCKWPVLLGIMLLLLATTAEARKSVRLQRDGVLGTSFEIEVVGSRGQAKRAERAALTEIARLEKLLSTWREDSELSAYNAGRLQRTALSSDTLEVLELCEQWWRRSNGAFSCRLGDIIQQWRAAAAQNRLPDRSQLRRQARELNRLVQAQPQQLQPDKGLRFDVDGVAKGYILDKAMVKARAAASQAQGIRIDIGGDALYWGQSSAEHDWTANIADPLQPLDNHAGLATVALSSAQGIAASGHRSRGFKIGRRHFSHILDPQEGWPISYAPAAVVVADTAADADALATALTVLPIRQGLALVESIDGAAALIVSDSGIRFTSTRWPQLLDAATKEPASTAAPVLIDYQIPQPASEIYRRPYLALWIERTDGSAVRQLLVLGDRTRWLGELPRWWRQYGRNDPAAALGLARPTRAPGSYSVAWDGRDDLGHRQAAGSYVLRIEAARIQHPPQGEIGATVIHVPQ